MIYRQALLIRGLSWNSSAYPTLFTDGEIARSSLPAGYGPLSDANLQIVTRLVPASISGATWTCSIREPVGVGSTPSCQLIEDSTGSFAKIFAPDPGNKATLQWAVASGTNLTTTIDHCTVFGEETDILSTNQILWVDKEAIQVLTTGTIVGESHPITSMTRGVCGSMARVHYVDPDAYCGDDGINDCLLLSTRMQWDDVKYEATLYVFAMSEDDPATVASTVWVWNGYVDERPTFNAGTQRWEVKVAHVTNLIKEHSIGGEKELLELDYAVQVVTEVNSEENPAGSTTLKLPQRVLFTIRRDLLDRLFRVPLHQPFNNDIAFTAALRTSILAGMPSVSYQIVGEVGGHTWVWQIDAQGWDTTKVQVPGILIAHSKNASCRDAPVTYPPTPSFPGRGGNLNAGFFKIPGQGKIRFDQGETPPKLRLRTKIVKSFPNALGTLLLSGYGDGVNHATFDVLIGGRGLYLDPTWIDIGTLPANPISVSLGTTQLLEHAGLRTDKYDYVLEPDTKLGDWLKNELYLHTSLLGYIPSTGKIAIRQWARPISSPTTLTALKGASNITETADRVSALKALFLERGYDPITLEPKYRKPLRLKGSTAKDVSEALTVRIWKQGTEFTDAELATGPLAHLEEALFGTTMGTPSQYDVSLPLTASVVFADQVRLTDSNIPTPAGLGLTAAPFLASGGDWRFEQGKQVVRVLLDVINDAIEQAPTSNGSGNTGGALQVTGVVSANTVSNTYEVEIDSLLDPSFDITVGHGNFWRTAKDNGEPVRVMSLTAHNPSGERPGPLELSATVVAITRGTDNRNRITLSVDSAWARGGYAISDIVKTGAILVPQDTVPAALNPTGADIPAVTSTAAANADLIQVSNPRQKNRKRHRISS